MSLVTKCAACRRKFKKDEDEAGPCPGCGSAQHLFYVDYFPEGRLKGRVRISIDPVVQDIEEAKGIDKLTRAGALEGRKPGSVKESLTAATIESLTPDYLDWVRLHLTNQTWREREYSMKYINKIIGNVPVMAFNDHHISLFQKTRNAQGVSNKTINKELYYVMGFLRFCRDEKKLMIRPVEMKKLPYARPLPIILSPGEVSRILDASTPFYRAFFLCLYSMGLRFSEARNLMWDDIDLENNAIRSKQKGGTFKLLPMSKRLKAALLKIGKPVMGKYVFLSRRKDNLNKPIVNCRKAIASICAKAGVSKHVNPHLFRHSLATHMMGAGINLRTVQAMLGHEDIGTTEYYTHVAMEHLRAAGDIIDAGIKQKKRKASLQNQSNKNKQINAGVSTA